MPFLTFLCTLVLATQVFAAKSELTIALNQEFETLNPVVNSMMAAVYVQDATLRPLVALSPEGKPYAVMIKEIPSFANKKARLNKSDKNSPLKVDIEILPKAQWGDGEPVTCEDVRMAWEVGKNPQVSTPNRNDYLNITDIQIDATDPKKCTISFKQAKWNFYLDFPRPISSHLEKKILAEYGDKAQAYERNTGYIRDVTNPGLYNGPYQVAELKLGSHIVLVPNSHFYGKAPVFQKVIFKFILNSAAMEANLRSGAVNMASSSGLSFDQALAFEKKIKTDHLPFEVVFVPGVIYSHMDFNLDDPVFQDVKVRQAMAYSLNRKQMTQAFFEGKEKPALHFSTELDSWFTRDPKEITIYPYNKVKAGQLLEQAGWRTGTDGFRYKDGKKLSFTLSGVADNKLNEMLEAYTQAQWKQIGAEVLIKNYPGRVFFAEIVRQRKYQMALYSWVSSPDASQRSTLHSEMIPTEANAWSGSNRPGWRNKDVDQWLDQVDEEFDRKKRIALMKNVLRAYTEELPALPLYYRANNAVIPKGFKNFHMSGHVYSEFLAIENWSF